MLTARMLCVAGMLLLASCENEPDRILPNIAIPPGMRAVTIIVKQNIRMVGVGDGNRTHNVRSHSPVLCRLSYSHRILSIIAIRVE